VRDPVRSRGNLHIETEALTERLLLDGKRCTGVRYSVAGEVREAGAGRAVVVSAGAFNSPQLLELSGIGQPERLRNLGIEVRAMSCLGLVKILQLLRNSWLVGKKGITFNDRGRGLGLAHQALRCALRRQGMLAMAGAPSRAFVCSREGLEAPDLMLGWISMLTEPTPGGPKISRQSGLTLYADAMRPESEGHVHIAAADPGKPPTLNLNFLSSPPDAELTVRAVRIARAIMTAPAMTPLQASEIAPGPEMTTDDEILDWVRNAAETTYHPVGTCKRGSDLMAVVDSQLRVHGITGLRIADASIMPTLTSGNTNAPSIMIGEKAADMLLNTVP
jgi:choline dehydrogenase